VAIDQLVLFVAAGLLLNLTPGPDVLYIVTQALRLGLRAGLLAALGISAGCFVHIFAAALGVSALILASSTAFTLLKWLGAAYLVGVGVRLLFARAVALPVLKMQQGTPPEPGAGRALSAVFMGAFWTNVLNPKVALFFLAFLPQFIAPTVEHKPLAFLLLGLLFNFNAVWVNLGWACAAVWLARKAGRLQVRLHWLDRIAGSLFIAFGLKLAFTHHPAP
jgi:threonine/homoserine/homoserine lactone efflux protein